MMQMKNRDLKQYEEIFPESFSIKLKRYYTEKRFFHMHNQLEVIFSLCDNLQCRFEDRQIDIPKFGFVVLDTHILHHIIAKDDNGPLDRYVLYFDPDYISSFSSGANNLLRCFLKSSIDHNSIFQIEERYIETVLAQLEKIERCKMRVCAFEANDDYCLMHEKFLLCEFLLMLNRLYDFAYGANHSELFDVHSSMVYQICDYVKSHISEDLSLDQISSEFGISKTQIYNIFKRITGKTLSDYISDYRITAAKDYIVNSDKTIDQISYLLGYASVSAFSRRFKASTLLSPLQYRKQNNL